MSVTWDTLHGVYKVKDLNKLGQRHSQVYFGLWIKIWYQKKILGPKNVGPKKLLVQKFLNPKEFWVKKKSWLTKNLSPKNIGQNDFGSKKKLWVKKIQVKEFA